MRSDIEKFRSDPIRVEEFRMLLGNATLAEVLELMINDSPETKPLGAGLTPTDAGIALGNGQGYRNYHDKFKAFAQMWPRRLTHEEEDYGAGPRPAETEE